MRKTLEPDLDNASEGKLRSLCARLIGMRAGELLIDGPTREMLTEENIERLYGVDVDVIAQADWRAVRVKRGTVRA